MEDYLLPCLNKKIFGLECLGCGIQRATALLFNGEFVAAFKMYPPIYLLILLLLLIIFNFFFPFKHDFKTKVVLSILTGVTIIASYFYKLFG